MNNELNGRSWGIAAAAIFIVSAFLFWPNPKMGYVLDDHYVIASNPIIKNASVSGIVTTGLFDSARRSLDSRLNYYRPVLSASFALDYAWWGLNPFAQRVVNLFLHAFNGLLVFALLYLLFGSPGRAFMAAVFFTVLPVQEWSVRYIVGRGDLLMAFFSLSSLITLIIYMRNHRNGWLWSGLIFFVLAVLSKEAALLNVALVFMVSLYITKDVQRTVRVTVFFAVVAVAYYVLRAQVFPMSEGAVLDSGGLLSGITQAVDYQLRYLMPWAAMQALPQGASIAVFWMICSFFLLVFGVMRSIDRQEKMSAIGFGLSWMAANGLGFLVTERIIPRLGPVLSEHFLYLGAVGFVLLLAVMIEQMSSVVIRKALFCAFVVYFLALSIVSGRYWTSEEDLLRHVQKIEAQEFTVADEQVAMRFEDDPQKVRTFINRAKSASTQSLWYKRLGNIERTQGRYPEAKMAFEKAVTLNPLNIEAINEWAVCYLETGEMPEGLRLLEHSLTIDPRQSDTYRLLGIALYRAGKFSVAAGYLKQAWRNDPDQSESSLHLMMSYFFMNNQTAYLEMVDQSTQRFDERLVLGFAAREFFSHGYFNETVKIISQSQRLFQNDPAMQALLSSAQGRTTSLPK